MSKLLFIPLFFLCTLTIAQTNIICTNDLARQIMLGDYSPSTYSSTTVINHHDSIIRGINNGINSDSLKSYIFKLASFENRNTGSDTTSLTIGIGAARKWAYDKFEQISADNENRLISSYLQFDQQICNMTQHKNVFAVLPGTDTADNKVIVIEAHMDSRCDDGCDSLCLAEGIEDNASGTALVLELARIMSKYTYKNTLVFMTTVGEEQGLYGANAFATYAVDSGIQIEAVLNNDVIGGIICGETSSPPSCPGLNDIDSTQVRLFSEGTFNSKNKQLVRFLKLEYKEELLPFVSVPMMLTVMSAEDRGGRGGDHIPFRQRGFAAMRFCSANEHGNGQNGAGYTDRQHSSTDIIGKDTNSDTFIDEYYIDFNYLARNAVINGNGAALAAIGPLSPDLAAQAIDGGGLVVNIIDQIQYAQYRIAVRTTSNDWDSVYTTNSLIDTIYPPLAGVYFISVASVDSLGIESLFSKELLALPTGITEYIEKRVPFQLMQNKPNPFDEVTTISVMVSDRTSYKNAFIIIRDIQGKVVQELPINLNNEMNEVAYEHGYGKVGVFSYTLVVDGVKMGTKNMIFAN